MSQNVTSAKVAGQKWIVAIDPFSDLDISRVIAYAKILAQPLSAEVRGAYVLAPESLNWTGEFSGPWMERYLPFAKEKAREVEKKYGIAIDVIPCGSPGLRPSVNALVEHAKNSKTDLLLLSTHARTGIERWTLGSYAETLILSSTIPVIVINPTHSLPKKIERVLVPTDLSAESEKFIFKLSEFARAGDAQMDLFFKQPDPLDPMIQQGVYAVGGGWVSVQSYMDTELGERRRQLENISATLRSSGIKSEICIDSTSPSLIEAINVCAKERKSDLIALLTQSGPLEAAVLGSVARGLVRSSPVPVLIRR